MAIVIINYGVGNLSSVQNMLKKAGATNVLISNSPEEILKADKIILPGVGHFDYGMTKLHESGLIPSIEDKVLSKKTPILGICLGAQLMTRRSDEGKIPGLGWVDGETIAFDSKRLTPEMKIPHMNWNYVTEKKTVDLYQNIPDQPRFYFVHSYHLNMNNEQDVWLTANYGYEFCAAYQTNNIYACQFHPEKSHKFGLRLMQNFVTL